MNGMDFSVKLAELIAVRPETVLATASALEAGGALGPSGLDRDVTPQWAAKLLAALLGSHNPADALTTLETLEGIPLGWYEGSFATRGPAAIGVGVIERIEKHKWHVEDYPITAGTGAWLAKLSASFVGALATIIESASTAQGLRPSGCLEMVAVARSPHQPIATIAIAAQVEGLPWQGSYVYAPASCRELMNQPEDWFGLAVGAAIRGQLIEQIGALIAGRPIGAPAAPLPESAESRAA